MAVTRLGLGGTPRHLYGTFSGKTVYVTPAITRLGLIGAPRHRYALSAFAGKTADIGGGGGPYIINFRRRRRS